MANIVDQKWIKDGAGGRMDEDGIIIFNESTIITFNEVVTDTPDAIASGGFQQGQEHRDNFNLTLSGAIEANPVDESNGSEWRFDLEYTTSAFGQSNTFGNSPPRATVKIGTWTYNQIVESDKENNQALANSAGDPYDPMPEEIIANPVLMITMRQNSAKISRVEDIGSVNDSSISIAGISFPKHTAMLAAYESDPVYDEEGYITFYNTYTIKANFKTSKDGDVIGWKLEMLSQGFNQIVDGIHGEIRVQSPKDPEADPVKYEWVPVAQPQMLDENGKATTDPAAADYKTYLVHNETSFSSFGLPSNFPVG